MQIYIVDKKSPHDLSNPLPDPSILLECNRRSPSAQSLLAQVRESKQELRCGCVAASPARMFIRFTHDFYTLVNHAEQGKHSDSCPLFSKIHGYSERTQEAPPAHDDEGEVERFVLHNNVNTQSAKPTQANEADKARAKRVRESKVDRLVRFLTEKSFSNFHYKGKKSSELKALRDLVEPSKLVTFGDTTLDQWTFYGDKGYHIATSALRRAIDSKQWNGAGRPHALVFMVCTNLQIMQGAISVNGVRYSVRNVERSGRDTRAPYIVALSIALNPSTGELETYNAYVKPILSSTALMPVDSHYERIVALGLIERIERSESKFRWSLQKPLFSKADRANTTSVLPDFILRSKNERKQINFVEVIEVMGMMSDPDYRTRKARLLPIMANVWRANKITEVDPTNSAKLDEFFAEHDRM